MKLLANENFPLASINYLKSKGYDIKGIGIDHAGHSDKAVLNLAIQENRTILTFDRDYGELIFKHGYQPSEGVIYLRLNSFTPHKPGEIVEKLITSDKYNFEKALTVVDDKSIRQRKY